MKTKIILVMAIFAILISLSFAAGIREKWQNAVQQYNNTRNQYMVAKDAYIAAKNNWTQIREQYMLNKSLENLHLAIFKAGKVLNSSVDHIEKYLEILGSKVENMTSLDTADKEWMLAQIESDKEAISALKAEAANVTNETSKEEFTAIRDKIKEQWFSVKAHVKQITGLMLASKMSQLITLGEQLGINASARLSNLTASGYNSTDLQTWLADYNSQLAIARQKVESAKASFKAITSPQDEEKNFQAGKNYLKEAKAALIQAHKDLKKMSRTMKQDKPGKSQVTNKTRNKQIEQEVDSETD